MQKLDKPILVPSMLKPAIALVAIFFAVIGVILWNAKADQERKWLESRGLENFSQTQMEAWKRCDSIVTTLGKLYEKIEDAGGSRPDLFRQVMPETCLYLHDLAAKTYAARANRGGR